MEYGTTGHHYKSVGESKNCLINDAGTLDNTREEKKLEYRKQNHYRKR